MTNIKNDTFKRYLLYLLKNNTLRDIILAFISSVFIITNLNSLIAHELFQNLEIVILILSAISPVLTFSKFNNKRNLDTIYSMPMDKKSLVLAHFISGGISMLFVYTVSFIFLLGYIMPKTTSPKMIGYLLAFYLFSVIFGISIYTFFSFIFTRANTTGDGIVFCFFWSFLITVITFAACFLKYIATGEDTVSEIVLLGLVPSVSELTIDLLVALMRNTGSVGAVFSTIPQDAKTMLFIGLPLWLGIGTVCGIALIKTFHKKAAQNAGEISSSIFGYKFIVPAMGFSLITSCYYTSAPIWYALIFISMVVGYIIYRRGVKFKKSDLVFLLLALIFTLISLFKN